MRDHFDRLVLQGRIVVAIDNDLGVDRGKRGDLGILAGLKAKMDNDAASETSAPAEPSNSAPEEPKAE